MDKPLLSNLDAPYPPAKRRPYKKRGYSKETAPFAHWGRGRSVRSTNLDNEETPPVRVTGSSMRCDHYQLANNSLLKEAPARVVGASPVSPKPRAGLAAP